MSERSRTSGGASGEGSSLAMREKEVWVEPFDTAETGRPFDEGGVPHAMSLLWPPTDPAGLRPWRLPAAETGRGGVARATGGGTGRRYSTTLCIMASGCSSARHAGSATLADAHARGRMSFTLRVVVSLRASRNRRSFRRLERDYVCMD